MPRLASVLFALSIATASVACDSDSPAKDRDSGVRGDAGLDAGNEHDAAVDGGGDGGVASICGELGASFGIASAALDALPAQLEVSAKLSGAGADGVMAGNASGANFGNGLVWHRDGLIVIGDGGFWDIPFSGSKRWMQTSTLVHGALAGDIDGDGDQDLLIMSGHVESTGLVDELVVWERTATGLVERSVVRKSGALIGLSFVFSDIDDDGDLDLLAYELGAPIGYINDGHFSFERVVLGQSLPEYAEGGALADQRGAVAMVQEDRNGDGALDLLVVLGGAYFFDFVVVLSDGDGGFLQGAVTKDQSTRRSASRSVTSPATASPMSSWKSSRRRRSCA